MEMFTLFFKGYFCQTFNFENLDEIIKDIKDSGSKRDKLDLIFDLQTIIKTKNYKEAYNIAARYGSKIFDLEKMEKFVLFLHDKLCNIPTNVKSTDFIKPHEEGDDEILNMELHLPTDPLTWFFEGYFNRMHPYEYLDESVTSFKYGEGEKKTRQLTDELKKIIKSSNYNKFLKRLKVHSLKKISLGKAKKLALFLYNRFTDTPTDIKPIDFKGMRK